MFLLLMYWLLGFFVIVMLIRLIRLLWRCSVGCVEVMWGIGVERWVWSSFVWVLLRYGWCFVRSLNRSMFVEYMFECLFVGVFVVCFGFM